MSTSTPCPISLKVLQVLNGVVKEGQLDDALVRVWSKAFMLGILDNRSPRNPYMHLNAKDVDTPASRELALEGALQSIVLLKNENATLPLAQGSLKKLALIGPHANGSTIFLGDLIQHFFFEQQCWLQGAQIIMATTVWSIITRLHFEQRRGCHMWTSPMSKVVLCLEMRLMV